MLSISSKLSLHLFLQMINYIDLGWMQLKTNSYCRSVSPSSMILPITIILRLHLMTLISTPPLTAFGVTYLNENRYAMKHS